MNMDGLCNLTEWTNRWWPVLELAEVKLSIYLKSVVKDCKKLFGRSVLAPTTLAPGSSWPHCCAPSPSLRHCDEILALIYWCLLDVFQIGGDTKHTDTWHMHAERNGVDFSLSIFMCRACFICIQISWCDH